LSLRRLNLFIGVEDFAGIAVEGSGALAVADDPCVYTRGCDVLGAVFGSILTPVVGPWCQDGDSRGVAAVKGRGS
jgi:hypothetical protein